MVYERGHLRRQVQEAALVLVARIEAGPAVWSAPGGADRQEFFSVRTLEVLRGTAPAEAFDFFPHAEGFPAWQAGQTALLFLEPTAAQAEFAPLAARFPFFSEQGAGQEWVLGPDRADGEAVLAAARRWAAREPPPAVLADQLASDSARLQSDALRALIADGDALLREAAAVRALADAGRALPLGRRAALGRILAGRPGFDAAAWWPPLLAEAEAGGQEVRLLPALGGVDDPAVEAWILRRLAAPDPAVRRAAAHALGRPGAARHVEALAAAARDPEAGVARAAIRALGAVGGEEANAALAALAAGDDPERARWARAQLGPRP